MYQPRSFPSRMRTEWAFLEPGMTPGSTEVWSELYMGRGSFSCPSDWVNEKALKLRAFAPIIMFPNYTAGRWATVEAGEHEVLLFFILKYSQIFHIVFVRI